MSQARQLLFDVVDKLANSPLWPGVPIVPQLARNPSSGGYITNAIEKAAGALQLSAGQTQAGLAVYIALPELKSSKLDTPGYFDQARMTLHVLEDQIANTSSGGFAPGNAGPRADDIAMLIKQLFPPWIPGGTAQSIACDECRVDDTMPAGIQKVVGAADLVVWTVGMVCALSLPMVARAPNVAISVSGGEVTVASGAFTGGIYYTTDGSLPTPGSTEYTSPFAVPTGKLLRAMAYPTSEGVDSGNCAAQQF
jgi:hypothetical protein